MKLKKHIAIILYVIMMISFTLSLCGLTVAAVLFYMSFMILYKYGNLKQVINDFINN